MLRKYRYRMLTKLGSQIQTAVKGILEARYRLCWYMQKSNLLKATKACRYFASQYRLNPKNWLTIIANPSPMATREDAHVSFSVILGTFSFNASLQDPINTV